MTRLAPSPNRPLPAMPPRWRQGTDAGCLADIHDTDINLVICTRSPDPALRHFSDAVAQNRSAVATVVDAPHVLGGFDAALGALPGYACWREDAAYWLDAFFCLFEAKRVGIRLQVLDRAMCPRFHVDQVPVRFIATYGEVGTEWLAEADVDRRLLGPRNDSRTDVELGLYPGEMAVRRVPPYGIALLKGERWEGNEGRGLVHRSPAVHAGDSRVLLTFDLID